MKLSQETAQLLSGFEKRMKFINIARFLLDYPKKDSIMQMVPNRDLMDNIIVAVLVFIKERTLGREQNCSLQDISDFLEELIPVLPGNLSIDPDVLARFIVVDALQKGGLLKSYQVLNAEKETMESMPIRLLEKEKGTYHLTDDAFDFLFRSKEIESELDYSVTRFRMAEYMKRDNYMEALDQSRELVSRIRSMKVSMDDFLRRCRENIGRITVDQYENVVSRVRALLESENEELEVIQESARKRAENFARARRSGVGSEEAEKHYRALGEIIKNIQLTIDEQRSLIIKKMSLSDAYQSILSDSYAMSRYERLNFDQDIMSRLRSGALPADRAAGYLLFPLTRPEFEKSFSIENFYALQTRIRDLEEEEAVDLESQAEEEDPAIARNARFLDICTALFSYMKVQKEFKISQFIASLSDEQIYEFCEENALPRVVLSLYALQNVSVSDWKKSQEMIMPPLGEFELSWCMSQMPQDFLEMDSFSLEKLEREFSFSVQGNAGQRRISMSDFLVEVKR